MQSLHRVLVLCVFAGLAVAAARPNVSSVAPAVKITYRIEAADSTSFLAAAAGCPSIRAHFEQSTTAEVDLMGCPLQDSAVGACVSLQTFTADSAVGGVLITNAHPYLRLNITTAETVGESRLTLHCSNTQL